MPTLKDNGDFRSRPHRPARYELIGKDGLLYGEFVSAQAAVEHARMKWPRQEQDEERAGKGWDIAVVGADR